MKSFDTEFKKYAEKLRLKASERHELRERILSYMEYHPLPKKKEKILNESIPSQHFIFIPFNTIYTRVAAGFFAVILLIGVPVLAERAVPGDALYLVKTQINEGLRAKLANTSYEKMELEISLIERRISEARLLASEGKLTDEVGAAIAETVKQHANKAQGSLDAIRNDNADDGAIAEITLGSALDIQSAVLDTDTRMFGTSTPTNDIKNAVNQARETANQKKGTSTPSYAVLLTRVEDGITRAKELFETIKESATDEERTDIERRFADIDRKIIAAAAENEKEDGIAIPMLTSTLGPIQKLIVFMTDIDVREHVSLETLVPVELTVEERTEDVLVVLDEVITIQKDIEQVIASSTEGSVPEKVTLGLNEVRTLVSIATTSLGSGNIEVAEDAVARAFNLAEDLRKLIEKVPETAQGEGVVEENHQEEAATSTGGSATAPKESSTSTSAS